MCFFYFPQFEPLTKKRTANTTQNTITPKINKYVSVSFTVFSTNRMKLKGTFLKKNKDKVSFLLIITAILKLIICRLGSNLQNYSAFLRVRNFFLFLSQSAITFLSTISRTSHMDKQCTAQGHYPNPFVFCFLVTLLSLKQGFKISSNSLMFALKGH